MFTKIKSFFDNLSKKSLYSSIYSQIGKGNSTWNDEDYLKAYQISLYVNACVRKRAEKVGEIQFKLKKGEKDVENHKLLKIINRPNELFTGAEFWYLYQVYKDLTGSAYIWKAGTALGGIESLHLLRPDWVEPQFDKNSARITGYKYRQPNGVEMDFGVSDIIPSHYPNPINQLKGASVLTDGGVNAVETEIQLSEYHANVIKNGGKVEGVFNFKAPSITKTQLQELKDKFKEQYAEAKKSGLPLFLGGEAEYKNMGLTPQELGFLEAKKMTLHDILLAFGVPKSILGVTSDETFSNADASIKIFLRETIKPLLKNLTERLNWFLVPDDLTLTFNDPTPEDRELILKENENGVRNYYITPNEARARVGLEPVKGGDSLLVPFNLVEIGDEAKNDKNAQKTIKKAEIEHPLKDEYVRRKYWESQNKKLEKKEKIFTKRVGAYFQDQKKRTADKISAQRTYRRKNLIEDVFDVQLEIKIAKNEFLPLLEKFLVEAGIDAMKLAGSEYDFNLSGEIGSWLGKKVEKFAGEINETTMDKLKKEFAESLANGEDRRTLAIRIENAFDEISKARAETIARTEVHGAVQYGTHEGYKQAGLPVKIWVAVMDSRTRDSHAFMDGMEVPINQPFPNGLQYPGDPNGATDEVINCRCQI